MKENDANYNKIMLIDGNSILNRAFYAIPHLTNAEGTPTNALYGFLNIMFKMIDDENPTHVGIAFDLKTPTFRNKMYKEYKANRSGMPEEMAIQLPILKTLINKMNINIYEQEGYEADDVLGSLSTFYAQKGNKVVVVSGDRDLLQLASEKIKIKIPKTKAKKTIVEDYFAKDVEEKYGVTPKEFIDVKALMGDTSDNIPGVPGIGEKTAVKIIKQYHDIEQAIADSKNIKPKRASNNLETYAEQARMSKVLATICTDCKVEQEVTEFNMQKAISNDVVDMLRKYEFKSLINRLENSANIENIDIETTKENYNIDYKLIQSESELIQVVKEIENSNMFAFKFIKDANNYVGLSLASDAKCFCIEVNENLLFEQVLNITKNIFEDNNIKKIGYHVKEDLHIFINNKVKFKGLEFDTMIAAYLLEPTDNSYEIERLSKQYLDLDLESKEDILGKGKKTLSWFETDKARRNNYAASLAFVSYKLKEILENKLVELDMLNLFNNIEMPLIEVLAYMEINGIKIKEGALEHYAEKLTKMIDKLSAEIYDLAGEKFNINSPKQLGKILFEKMDLPVIKKTKTGYSTSAEVLEKLADKHPIINKIKDVRQLTKLKSTYAEGLHNVMDKKTEKIYTTFNQMVTATGRISSTDPNLQNIPIKMEIGRELRKIFIPSNEDYIFVDADYSQIELRLLAHLSDDKTLIKAYNENEDIHRLTASQVFNTPFDEVTSFQRSNAKAVNFGIIYGISAFSLSQDLNITRKEANDYINAYFEKYPNVKLYLDECVKKAKHTGYAVTMYGRRRYIDELKSRNFNIRSFGERVAMNMPIQGTAADIIKIAMINVHKKLSNNNMKSKLILQVHDELLIEAHVDELEDVKLILKEEMMKAAELSVPLIVDMHSANNWYDVK